MNWKNNKNKIILFLLSFTVAVVIYFFYIYYYYNEITIVAFIKHTVGSLNLLGSYIYYIVNHLLSNEVLLQTVVISISAIYILNKIDIANFISSLSSMEFLGVKLLAKDKAIEEKKEEDKKIEEIQNTPNSNENKLDYSIIKSKLIEILMDNPRMIPLIDKSITSSHTFKLPMNTIPTLYKMQDINEIFDYKLYSNGVKILGIKKDIKPMLVDAYNELKQKSIIY